MSRDDTRHLLSRVLPAFGFGILGTFLVCRVGWLASTPLQRGVFGLGALCVLAGLALDWFRRVPGEEERRAPVDTADR